MNKDLFGCTSKIERKFFIYHDESGRVKKDRWFFTGLLFIPYEKKDVLSNDLMQIKKELNCMRSEIHFSDLPKSFGGEFGKKAQVAIKWLDFFEKQACTYIFFSVMALDQKSSAYNARRFPKEFYTYNRFTVMALKSAIRWFFQNYNKLVFNMISDEKSRSRKHIKDNFVSYVPARIEGEWVSASIRKEGEKIILVFENRYQQEIKFESDVKITMSSNDVILQFCDILLGAISEAIDMRASRQVKLELASKVYRWLLDIRKKPCEQEFGLHKILSLWYFPNKDGRPYNNGQLEIKKYIERDQLRLL